MAGRLSGDVSQAIAAVALVALVVAATDCARAPGQSHQHQVDTVPGALACARMTLGGGDALASVSSLSVTFDITPESANERGRPSTTEITLGFPDTFKATHKLTLPNGRDLVSVRGFAGDRQLVGPVGEGQVQLGEPDEGAFRSNRHAFARWVLMLLLRETRHTPLTWSRDLTSDDAHFSVHATGPDDFNVTLLLDKVSCQPVAVVWDRAPNIGDGMSGRTSTTGRHVERRDLLEYQAFDGIRLPTLVRVAIDEVPMFAWRVTSALVNPPLPDDLANSSGSWPDTRIP